MIIHIVAGGPNQYTPDLTVYRNNPDIIWIGVDRGTVYLLENGLEPNVAIGDFDSVTIEDYSVLKERHINIVKYPAEKDETDMELALHLALNRYKPKLIRIFGATGGRLDHFFANIHLFTVTKEKHPNVSLEVIDKRNTIEVKTPGLYKIEKSVDKCYISFIPMTKTVENLTLEGFKYPLKNRHISFGSTLCISNELIYDSGTYSFSKGILLVIRSGDE